MTPRCPLAETEKPVSALADNAKSDFWCELESEPAKEEITFRGHTLYACEMSFDDWCRYQFALGETYAEESAEMARRRQLALLVVHSVADAEGKLFFMLDDVPRLMSGRWSKVAEIHHKCSRVNRMDAASVEAAKKNSATPQDSPGSTDSLATSGSATPSA